MPQSNVVSAVELEERRTNVLRIDSPRPWSTRPQIVSISQQTAADLTEHLGEAYGYIDLHNAVVITGRHARYGEITVVIAGNGDACVTSRHQDIEELMFRKSARS